MLNQTAQVDIQQTAKTQTKNDIQDTSINLSKILFLFLINNLKYKINLF